MTPLENLRTQLEMFRDFKRIGKPPDWPHPFLCDADLLLQRGTVFHKSPRRPPVEPWARACFDQSYRLTQRHNSRWIYCEGYAVGSLGLAVHHAWVIAPNAPTEAVELAWADATVDNSAYIGIPFRREFVRDMYAASKRRQYSVIDTPWVRYPLLTGKIPLEDVIWRAA